MSIVVNLIPQVKNMKISTRLETFDNVVSIPQMIHLQYFGGETQ